MYLYLSRHNNTINKKKAIEKLCVVRKVSDKGKTLNPNTLFCVCFLKTVTVVVRFFVSLVFCAGKKKKKTGRDDVEEEEEHPK